MDPLDVIREIDRAVSARDRAQARIVEAVALGRSVGLSWHALGLALGTTGEAARQRYGRKG